MLHISKEQQPLFNELKEIEKQMRQSAEQANMYKNSLMILSQTIKKNQLTIKKLQKIAPQKVIYVPLGRAFLRRDKDETIKDLKAANTKLQENVKEIEANQKYYTEKANEKFAILKEGTQKLMKKN